jgi:hypothetical protein
MHHAFHLALAQSHAADLQRIAAAARLRRTPRTSVKTRAAQGAAGVVAVLLALGGCGVSDDDRASMPAAAAGGAAAVPPQVVRHYVAHFDAAQSERLFGNAENNPEGVDPADLVGSWEMEINETLQVLDTHAPDKGGPVLRILEHRGSRLVLTERQCPDEIVLRARETKEWLTLEHVSGRCPGTVDLLVDEPWRFVRTEVAGKPR